MSNQGSGAITRHEGGGGERGLATRESFGTTEMTRTGETASAAVAAQARASVEARFVMALQRPRDMDNVRTQLLKACRRPGFARTAVYAKPVGGGAPVRGLSVRFAEEAARCMTNLLIEAPVVFDDPTQQHVRVTVTDLEANVAFCEDVIVEKTVERRQLREGQRAIASRTNSGGQLVYIVAATDDDLLNKRNALKSKAIRNGIIRVLPGDIAEEARAVAEATARDQKAKDPDANRKSLADDFGKLGITPTHLAEYLGRPLSSATVDEMIELDEVFTAVNTRETTWADVMARKTGEAEKTATKTKSNDLKDALNKKSGRGQQAVVAEQDAPPPREPGDDR